MSNQCGAIKTDGKICNAKGKVHLSFGSYCLRHFNLSFAKDAKFRQQVKDNDRELYDRLTKEDDSDSETNSDIEDFKKSKEILAPIKKILDRNINDVIKHISIDDKESMVQVDDIIRYIQHKMIVKANEKKEAAEEKRVDAERARIAEVERARVERLVEEVRIAALNAANAHRDIIFARDPSGSIDLKAFANDEQSIHRSSVQNETKKSVEILLTRHVPYEQNTLEEIIQLFVEPKNFYWKTEENCLQAIDELTKDYNTAESFGYKYADVCDRIWMFIKEQNKKDPTNHLNLRLACETLEGIGMCANGKMARLINILQGFDDKLNIGQKSREYFQCKMSIVSKLPKEKRKGEAMQLFEIFEIPEEEHDVWIDALMETDD